MACSSPMLAAYPDPNSNARLGTGERGQPLFDALEDLVMTAQKARAAGPGGKVGERRAHRLRQIRMLGKPEVVVRDEIDPTRQPHLPQEPRVSQLRQRGCKTILKFLPCGHA